MKRTKNHEICAEPKLPIVGEMCSLRNVKLANEMIEGVSLIYIKGSYYWRCTVNGVLYPKNSANGIAEMFVFMESARPASADD